MMKFTVDALPETLKTFFKEKRDADGSNISCEEAIMLYSAIRHLRPTTTIETGLAYGVSTVAILQALKDNGKGTHSALDPYQKNYKYAGVTTVKEAGLSDLFTFIEKFPEEVIPSLPMIQFAFIDSSHLFDETLMEFYLIDKRMEVGGVIGFHDVGWMPSLQEVIRYILTNRSYRLRSFNGDLLGTTLSLREKLKVVIAAILRKIPKADKYFTQDVLRPWQTICRSTLIFIEKVSNDDRDWKFHKVF